MAGGVKLKEQAERFIELMAEPGHDTSDRALADTLGVSITTIRNWKQKTELQKAIEQRARDCSDARIPQVWERLLESAIDGDVQAARLIYQLRGDLNKKPDPEDPTPPAVTITFSTHPAATEKGADR